MPRRLRQDDGGFVYHVLNRGVGRSRIFDKAVDYEAFVRVLAEALDWVDVRLLGYCVMPNHWHLVVWPENDGDLSEFMRWVAVTHTQSWHANRPTQGTGPIYQGRYKSFPVAYDDHCLRVPRYVERNPVRAKLVRRVDAAETEAELAASRRSVVRGVPYGKESWQKRIAKRLALESSMRPIGRPPKAAENARKR